MRRLAPLALWLTACTTTGDISGDPSGQDAQVTKPSADAGRIDPPDAGAASLTELDFAVVGDTRPAAPDDTANYPSDIIDTIWQDVEAEKPHPAFAISTGDYVFASIYHDEQAAQFAKYMAARAFYHGPWYPAMGNHECTGGTASNCGLGAHNGVTKNLTGFVTSMLTPIGMTSPYYVEHAAAADHSWTAKFVFVACNAWSADQATWLGQALAEPTTYTFVVRHEGVTAMSLTPCADSQPIIDEAPMTLLIVGHTHEYAHSPSHHEIIVGNGGAPLTSGSNYGYVIVARNADGTLTITAYDYQSHAMMSQFSIRADGSPK